MSNTNNYDYIIIGSGFGGAVSALRLAEKGYKVLVIEKGKWLKASDFPTSNWQFKKWLWLPALRFFGLFKMTMFRHITVLSGTGVGGGSLVYANTLPVPKRDFFMADSWSHLADWETELRPYYDLAYKMLGAAPNPRLEHGDLTLQTLARQLDKESSFEATKVAVFFGEPGKTVPDPYFDGEGPERAGCTFCAGCMLGCRHNAKNTLDKNYLYLAQKHGATIQAESEVFDVRPDGAADGSDGYVVHWRQSTRLFKKKGEIRTKGVIFAAGVMGTVPLLLKLAEKSLPNLSGMVGKGIRTNSETLIGITSLDKEQEFCHGVAIGSILHTDERSHLEPFRYPAGSGFWRLLMSPMTSGGGLFTRIRTLLADLWHNPGNNWRVLFTDDWSKRTQGLLFMQTLDSTLRFRRSWFGMRSTVSEGSSPTPFIPESLSLAEQYAKITNGKPMVLLSETLGGIPTTAHILGGAIMGDSPTTGVIDKNNGVWGYENMMVCDGSMISANLGVNPSLTITAISERALAQIPSKE